MKTLRKNGGFTLVELIVVIAILAILAGVAVPAYSGYIKKANDAVALTQLDALKTAILAADSTDGDSDTVTGIEITVSSKKIETTGDTDVTYSDFFTTTDVTNLLNALSKSDTFQATAKWSSSTGKWTK